MFIFYFLQTDESISENDQKKKTTITNSWNHSSTVWHQLLMWMAKPHMRIESWNEWINNSNAEKKMRERNTKRARRWAANVEF